MWLPHLYDPIHDLPFQDVERHRAMAQNNVVEMADVKARTKLLLRLGP